MMGLRARLFETQLIKSWQTDTRANVAMIFGLGLLVLLVLAGFALDNRRHLSEQTRVQNALDTAALASAKAYKQDDLSDAELNTVAQRFFMAHFENIDNVTLDAVQAEVVDEEVILNVTGAFETNIMGLMGRDELPLKAISAAVYDRIVPAELAMVLDTSDSMSGSKLSALKTAAKSLVETVLPSNVPAENEAAKVAIVPFSTYVNVGVDKRYESWVDADPRTSQTRNVCRVKAGEYSRHCTRRTRRCYRDGVPSTCRYWGCPGNVELERECQDEVRTQDWYGCVASRSAPLNVKDERYGIIKIYGPAMSSAHKCPSAITALSNNRHSVTGAIDALVARQDTYIATGLSWGLRTLSPGAPFSEGEAYSTFYDRNGRKVLLLMSDGANTKSPNSQGLHNQGDTSAANATTLEVCAEAKSLGMFIYTIEFEISDAATKTMLETCSSGADYYFDAANTARLQQAFDDIGESLRELAISQ